MRKAKAAAPAANETEAAEVAVIEGVAATFAPDPYFCRGDARDTMLDVIRSTADWSKLGENRQRDINKAVDNAAGEIVGKITREIAAQGRETLNATIDQIVLKDGGIKIVLKATFDSHMLSLLAGTSVVEVAIADPAAFQHDRAPARVDPDQGDLIPSDDGDLVDAADEPEVKHLQIADTLKTGDAIYIDKHGDCEVEINLKTGMVEAVPRQGDSSADRIDLREATADELAAERNRIADFEAEETAKEKDAIAA